MIVAAGRLNSGASRAGLEVLGFYVCTAVWRTS